MQNNNQRLYEYLVLIREDGNVSNRRNWEKQNFPDEQRLSAFQADINGRYVNWVKGINAQGSVAPLYPFTRLTEAGYQFIENYERNNN